jgi:transcriptional regulator with XRE-family HTH domain
MTAHQDSHEGPGPLTAKATGRKSTVPKPGSMRSPSAGMGRQELAMAPTSKPKDHFFPRVHATARLIATARRRARLTRKQLADAVGVPPNPGAELIRHVETGRHPFPHPEHVRRMVEVLGLDAGALFLAQCQDFEELDRRDPVLQFSCGGQLYEYRPPAHQNDEEVRAGAREFVRRVDESTFLEGRGSWTTQACIRWSAIRAEYLHVSGRSAMGFRPLMRDVRAEDEPWLRLWAVTLELWLGARGVAASG